MNTPLPPSKPALGFLTVVEHTEQGLFGGYLVLNASGRPLEFHCTAPIRPNRAQEILYGPTLKPFLYGEQIGHTLVAKSKLAPLAVCTDQEPGLAVRDFVDMPVVLVLPPEDGEEPEQTGGAIARGDREERLWRIDSSHCGLSRFDTFRLGRNRLALPQGASEDRTLITDRLGALAESFDLAEPFERIREAIEEALRGGQ
jgi:hypothetical protein